MIVVPPTPAPVASVSVVLAASLITPGQTTQGTATTLDADNNVLTGRVIGWSSSNTGVATVSAAGLVRAVAVGTAQIRATSEGQTGSAALTVAAIAPVPVASVSVTLAASSRNPGQTTQATATTRDANNNVLTGRAITWSSSNTGVATVSGSGLVTAIAVGAVQINRRVRRGRVPAQRSRDVCHSSAGCVGGSGARYRLPQSGIDHAGDRDDARREQQCANGASDRVELEATRLSQRSRHRALLLL